MTSTRAWSMRLPITPASASSWSSQAATARSRLARTACILESGKVDGVDPLEPYGEYAAASLKRLDSMSNSGDLVVISMLDTDTDQVAAFEELIGSHGGLGGPQTVPLILYPFDWELDPEPMIGAPAVYAQLIRWMRQPDSKPSAKATDNPVQPSKPTTTRRRRT